MALRFYYIFISTFAVVRDTTSSRGNSGICNICFLSSSGIGAKGVA